MRRHDPDRFFCTLFAPARHRETLFLLYAFNHELARAREATSQPTLALIRLQWWREVVEGADRAHEVASPLAAALRAGWLRPETLLTMIEGREMAAEATIPTFEVFQAYVRATAGTLAEAAGEALGADGATGGRLRAAGTAYGVAGVLRSVAVLARQGRCLLPADLLAKHGLSAEAVAADPETTRLAPVRDRLIAWGTAQLRAGAGRYPRAAVAAALPAAFASRDLGRGSTSGPRPFGDRIAVAWAAARKSIPARRHD